MHSNHHPSLRSMTALLLASAFVAGCGEEAFESLADQAVDSQDIGATESALTAMGTEGVAGGMDPETAARQAGDSVKRSLADPACHTATRTGATVVHAFQNCTGRYGLVRVTGTLTVVFSGTPEKLAFVVTGTGVRVNRAVIDVESSGTLATSGTTKTLSVNTKGRGTGPRGNALERDGAYVATYDTATECGGLDGEWSLSVGLRDRTTKVAGVRKCKDRCPSAGSITHQGLGGRTVTVTFDGSSIAAWSGGRGHTGTVDLACAPAE